MTTPDPFASSESAPSISFKESNVGDVKSIVADGPAKQIQQTVFGTDGVKAFWMNKDGTQGNPKMAAVVNGTDPNTGEAVSLWAPIPGDLCSKIFEAQKKVSPNYRIDAGTRIDVKLAGREPSGKGNPKNVHAVRITPAAASDPFEKADPTPPAATPQQSAAFGDEPPF